MTFVPCLARPFSMSRPLVGKNIYTAHMIQDLPTMYDMPDMMDRVESTADPLIFALTIYFTTLFLLTWWDAFIAPSLYGGSTIYSSNDAFSKDEQEMMWIHPITCDQSIPLPSLEDLKTKKAHRIGSKKSILTNSRVTQFITVNPVVYKPQIREKSKAWSDFYNSTIYIYKQKN